MKLRDALKGDDRWHLFDNLMLDSNSDIDHVLLGPAGLFVISTKSQRGWFQSRDKRGGCTMNGQPVDWPQDATRQALRLKDQLAVLEPAKQPWIQAVLALPFAHIETAATAHDVPATGPCWVVHEDNLLDHLCPEPIPKTRKLAKPEIKRWANALNQLYERQS